MRRTITVLIKFSEMSRIFKNKYSNENVQSFTNYLLQPYVQLNYFTFCDYSNVDEPIFGCYKPNLFLIKAQKLHTEQSLIIKRLCKSNTIGITDIDKQTEIIKMLSGRFSNQTFFYNSINDSTFIDENTYKEITEYPELYILSEVNVNK